MHGPAGTVSRSMVRVCVGVMSVKGVVCMTICVRGGAAWKGELCKGCGLCRTCRMSNGESVVREGEVCS